MVESEQGLKGKEGGKRGKNRYSSAPSKTAIGFRGKLFLR